MCFSLEWNTTASTLCGVLTEAVLPEYFLPEDIEFRFQRNLSTGNVFTNDLIVLMVFPWAQILLPVPVKSI